MDDYLLILTLTGAATFAMAWMPGFSKKTGISYSIFYILAGVVLYLAVPEYLPDPLPQNNKNFTLHLTELIVIVSLMGSGIKIDRPFSFKAWSSPLKLIGITMLLCIAAAALMGYYVLSLGLASAVLLGAALAPTDPVLAADVQVGPPNDKAKSEVKFTLTSEAGLNDGVAFPFTWLAIVLGLMVSGSQVSFLEWFAFDVLYRLGAGVLIGWACGKGIGFLLFRISEKNGPLASRDGFLAIAATLLVYGLTEFAHGYGFLAVFICSITLRHYEKDHHYHKELHSFTDQTERLLLSLLMILFGGALVMGILQPINKEMIIFAVVFLLVIRPLAGWLAMATSKIQNREKWAIGFFGIKGLGSVFYLSFGFSEFHFEHQDQLWAVVFLTILLSIIMHGLSATTVMKKVE
ncbi:cation:proton antiporter [Chryseobacterium hagamense]|uniref:Cation transporter n=1 Tax=Chryseobacterium hagamense TaxID=395935 RepID=A0A511YRT6_9FLAO|nr:cation:proton antiporter [Chryseobacterium hagamense]GEN77904.1 cation transporter [Chryseobacterium hagamense]